MSKKNIVLLLVLLTVGTGFLREHVFVSLNARIENGLDPDGDLAIRKWLLTFIFAILYFILTASFVYAIFRKRRYILFSFYVYVLLFGASAMASIVGIGFLTFQQVYPFVRSIMGVAQSPVVIMIMIAVSYINDNRLIKD